MAPKEDEPAKDADTETMEVAPSEVVLTMGDLMSCTVRTPLWSTLWRRCRVWTKQGKPPNR